MKRLWRNRWAWFREQLIIFSKRSDYIYIALAFLAVIARIFRDVVQSRPISKYGEIEPELRQYWEARISEVVDILPDLK